MAEDAKELLRTWCKMQQDKYGPDWKRKLAEEMVKEQEPFLNFLFGRRKA